MRYFEYVKRTVPMHDDLYDFFLRELPGYDMVGYRETEPRQLGLRSTTPTTSTTTTGT